MVIFVYGTLLRGLNLHSALKTGDYLGLATVNGELFDLGYFPGLLAGQQSIVGEIYRVNEATLQQLDQIEGVNPTHPASSHYLRQQTEATLLADGSIHTVELYRYNCSVAGKTAIGCGDYRRYLLEQQSDEQWVVAYGSNLDPNRLMDRVGTVTEWQAGVLPGFTLRFNKAASHSSGNCYANIGHDANKRCPAVAYRLSREQMATLDGYEGVPNHYRRIALPFYSENPAIEFAQVYIAQPEQLIEGAEPTPAYRGHIEAGYRYHQL